MNNSNTTIRKLQFLVLMASFGCLGPILRAITLPVPVIVCLRAWLAAIAIVLFILLSRRHPDREGIAVCFKPAAVSGILLAADWIGLFSAYNYTTIATATVCYYIVPILVLIAAPFVLGERFTRRHAVCTLIAFGGMVLVSGAVQNGLPAPSELRGILFALFGAAAYAAIILINRRFPKGDPFLRTALQLSTAALFTTPYILSTTDLDTLEFTSQNILLLLLLGVGLTAITYIAYFSLILLIPVRTIAIFSYADPVAAVLLSIFFLGEPTSVFEISGAALIILAAIAAEYRS